MNGPPIPQRIPALTWRKPAFLWTPIALALAISWPLALFYGNPGSQRLAVTALFAVFGLSLMTLGVRWAMGKAPKMRSIVVSHIVLVSLLVALLSPLALSGLLGTQSAGEQVTFSMSLSILPLILLIGLPIALVSGVLFAWTALTRPKSKDDLIVTFQGDVQPFR
ncbi:MAG: hypothetical protein M0D54_05295 [Hyphomonadaceae bacterium JAD_PAG50586_4]|nr:MAG: hypothetical protein M0D54_05295 [Hyphomonadaceae bacterium JAD_PAG50586_4]